jgi:hypothetical protein
MTTVSATPKSKEFLNSIRPLIFGVPTFLIVSVFLLWSLVKLASWVFEVLVDVK